MAVIVLNYVCYLSLHGCYFHWLGRDVYECVSLFDGLAYVFHDKLKSYGSEPKVVLVTGNRLCIFLLQWWIWVLEIWRMDPYSAVNTLYRFYSFFNSFLILFFILLLCRVILVLCTTRKQRHTEGKNRRYVVGITLFRRHTDEKSPRK